MIKGIKLLLEKIGKIFSKLFAKAEDVFDKVEPLVREALLYGTGITSVINEQMHNDPTAILFFVQAAFPNATEEEIQVLLNKAINYIETGTLLDGGSSLQNDRDLLTTIEIVAAYLKSKRSKGGDAWAFASDALAKAIALAKAPKGTKFAIIASLITMVYHKFFHKNKDADVDEPVTTVA